MDSYTWNGVTYTESGQYVQVLETSLGCDSTVSMELVMNYTNIEDYETTMVTIYPNPTNDLVVVEFNAASAQIEILDAQGKLIQTSTIVSGDQISLKNEQSGVYFVKIITENASTVHRIVKQ